MPFDELMAEYPEVYGIIQSALALFIVINPRAVASVFVGLTEGMDRGLITMKSASADWMIP